MYPSRSLVPQPVKVKAAIAELKHLGAPIKGLSMTTKRTEGAPLTAVRLENVVIEEDRVECRPGSRMAYRHASHKAIEALIPYYGVNSKIAAATNGEIRLLNDTLVKGGFTSNDWHFTAFSNLSAVQFTVMVNGKDGVWSWDGSTSSTAQTVVPVTSLSKSNPATCTVAAADIAKFKNGDIVLIKGAVGVGLINANGYHRIYKVGSPANTFTLQGVDTSAAAAAQTTGVTATDMATGMVKEDVTVPEWLPHIVPNQFDIVISHMNRLWFADKTNLSIYYLPIQQKGGEVAEFPLNAIFKRGGYVKAMFTWTVDGGVGIDDQLVIFTSNGECAIYSGFDPDSNFELAGVYRFDSPMSKNCVVNYGGELHVLVATGLVPMSTLMRAEDQKLGKYDQDVYALFTDQSRNYRSFSGWSVFIDPNTGRAICNLPNGGANRYVQGVRSMQSPAWTHWSNIYSRCWGWVNDMVYYGDDSGTVYEFDKKYLSDQSATGARRSIKIDIQMAWNSYGSSAIKQFKMILPYIITDGVPKPYVDFRVDYDYSTPLNQPDVTTAADGATWNVTGWDEDPAGDGDYWAGGVKNWNNWQGIAAIGRVGAPRIVVNVSNCTFALAGFDILYETGGVFG